MDETIVGYTVGKPYTGPEINGPFGNGVGLIFEGVPIYKIWIESPTDDEIGILRGICTHVGLSTTRPKIAAMPFFLFRDANGKSFKIQAPMCCLRDEVERWAEGDSNVFTFVLIDSESRLVKFIGTLGVPNPFKRTLTDIWSSNAHLEALVPDNRRDMLAVISEPPNLEPSTTWVFDSVKEEFVLMSSEGLTSSILEAARPRVSDIEILVGEKIEFLAYDSKLAVKRHDTGEVLAIDSQRNITAFLQDQNRTIRFNLNDYPFIGYGYAPAGVPAKLQSPESLFMPDEDNREERRVVLIQELLEPYGYVPIERPSKRSSAPNRV